MQKRGIPKMHPNADVIDISTLDIPEEYKIDKAALYLNVSFNITNIVRYKYTHSVHPQRRGKVYEVRCRLMPIFLIQE
jgi:hypothetical protein